MRYVTYLHLLNAVLIIITLVGLAFIMQPGNNVESRINFYILFVFVSCLITIVLAIFNVSLKNKSSVWLKPVSKKVSMYFINFIVVLWLCLYGFLVFVMLYASSVSVLSVVLACLSLFVTVVYGRYLKKTFFHYSLLGYGVSSIAVLLLILSVLAVLAVSGLIQPKVG